MRRAIIAVLALAGCSSQHVRLIGFNQYMVTAPPSQVFVKANETCAKLGRLVTSPSIQTGTNVGYSRYEQIKFQCMSAYEVVPVDKNSYKIWVPTSEIPVADTCATCVPPQKMRVPDLPAVYPQAKQTASEYGAKMNRTMVQAGGGFDIGTGLNVIFGCVP